MSFDVGTAIGYLDLDTSGFKRGFKSALDDLETFNNKANSASDRTYALGSSFKSAGSTLTKSVTLPLVGVGTAAVAVGNKFESAMSRVKAISGATESEFEALTDQALDLGASTAFSASEAAAGMENLASAGFTVDEILEAMPGLLDLAASSGADLATSSEIAASAIRGFGLQASTAGHVADVFAEAAARTNAQTEDMGEAMKYVAPVASAMNQSLEETAAAIGIMSDAGIKGSQAGTALRGALSRLAKPTDAMCATMERFGLSFFDAQGNMIPLNGIVSELETKLGKLTQEERNNAIVTLFGQNALSGILALMSRGSGDLIELTKSFEEVDGAAAEMAETMMDNTSGSIEEMMGSIETLAIKLQQVLAPVVTKVVNSITEFVNKISDMDKSTLQLLVTLAGVAAAIGPVMVVIGKLLMVVGKLPQTITAVKTGLGILKGAITGISAPVVAVVSVIAVLIAAFKHMWETNEEFRDTITSIWQGIVGMFTDFFAQITEKINSLGFNFESFGEVLQTVWQGLCDFLAPVFIGVFQYISNTIQTILNVILGVVDFFIAVFTGDWEGAWDAVKGIFESVWNGIVSWFENITSTIISVAQTVLSWFGVEWNTTTEEVGNTFKSIWQGIADFFVNLWNGIKDFFTGLWQTIWNSVEPLFNEIVGAFQMAWEVIKLVWDYVQPYFAGIWEGIKAVFSVIGEWFKTVFSVAWDLIKAVWSVVVAWFTRIWENIKAVFSVVGTWFKGIFSVAWEAIKAVWNGVIAFFTMIWAGIKAVFAVVKGVLSGNFTDAWNAIKNLWDKAVNYFSTVWTGVKNVFSAVGTFFKDTFSAAWEAVKKVFSNFGTFFSSLWDTIKNTFSSIGTKIGSAISSAVKSGINGVLGMIEGTVNTFVRMINGAITLINKIPGVNIGKLSELNIPRLATGGVVNRPTIAEIGEDGAEAIVPLEKNLGWIKNLVSMLMSSLAEFFNKQLRLAEQLEDIRVICQSILEVGKSFVTVDSDYVPRRNPYAEDGARVKPDNPDPSPRSAGDTYNFYSPKAIDEIEAAKQIKRTKLELAEGF